MQCPRCGHDNRIGAAFCSACGSSLAYLLGRARLQPGDALKGGAYEVVRPLSQGGMGAIYLVKDLGAFGRLRVLKEMLDYVDPADYPDRTTYEQAVQRAHERFEDEARILASLRHTGIPAIVSYFTEMGRNYIVMEYVEGKDLEEGLTRVDDAGQVVSGQPYPIQDVVRWGIQVCRILEYLEQQEPNPVIHHDIKPANLLLDKHTGDIRLVDFGTAQARLVAQADPKLGVRRSSVFGTIGYAPPEQYQGKSVPQSDVYALAATMYHLMTDDDPQQHPMSFPWPTSLSRTLSRALSRAVEPDLRKRTTAGQLRQALEYGLSRSQARRPADRKGSFRVVLMQVPDQKVAQTVAALQQELSVTETEAIMTAYSAPRAVMSGTSYAAAADVASKLQLAGTNAMLVEVDEHYSQTIEPASLRQQLLKSGQLGKIVGTRLGRDRLCHCYVCGHGWTAPRTRGRRLPAECPRCSSTQWGLRRVFKCRICGHEFAHGDHSSPPQQLFPACPACGTIDWLNQRAPVLSLEKRRLDLGTVRLGDRPSAAFSIVNRGGGTLRGIVRCSEPWLQYERSFTGGGEIILPLNTEMLAGETDYQGVVEVLSNGGAEQVHVVFSAQTRERVEVAPTVLDLGKIDAKSAPRLLRVTNVGGGVLRGSASADAPWIRISNGDINGNILDLRVVAVPERMAAGQVAKASISISTNGGTVRVPVRAHPLPQRIVLTPDQLDFGQVPPVERHQLVVRVSNAGTGRLKGRAVTWPDWVNLKRVRWSGNAVDLAVEVDGRRLDGTSPQTGIVRFASNGGEADLRVQAEAMGPSLNAEPQSLDFGALSAGLRAKEQVRLVNGGWGRLEGTVRASESWLVVQPQRLAAKRTTLNIWLRTDGLSPGDYSGAIEIDSNGGRTSIPVHVRISSQIQPKRRFRLRR